ncbi:cysteine-rich CWC family protein [Chitinophagaceae bacterium LWZ2-11]
MPSHEEKNCSRCNALFECKVGDIAHCHCTTVTLTNEERSFIESRYNDCLCNKCLIELKNKYVLFKEKFFL